MPDQRQRAKCAATRSKEITGELTKRHTNAHFLSDHESFQNAAAFLLNASVIFVINIEVGEKPNSST